MDEATLLEDGWELESAQKRHAACPHKFHVPDDGELRNLESGDLVKLLFLFWENDDPRNNRVTAQRMWVRIASTSESGLTGILESRPVRSSVLKPGDVIEFAPEHVASIFITRDDPRHPHHGSRACAGSMQRLQRLASGLLTFVAFGAVSAVAVWSQLPSPPAGPGPISTIGQLAVLCLVGPLVFAWASGPHPLSALELGCAVALPLSSVAVLYFGYARRRSTLALVTAAVVWCGFGAYSAYAAVTGSI